jgi:GNAT superfamily N-acetyltransferase
MTEGLQIREAQRGDVPLILSFIRELGEFEKLAHEVVATEETLERALFGKRAYAEVLIAEVDGAPAGFALFFHNFSTFLGKPGVYLEDVFVRPEFRGRGIGSEIFRRLARLALERDCGRLEFWVLDWNRPAIDFYRKIGAVAMDEWTVQRITGEALKNLAASN